MKEVKNWSPYQLPRRRTVLRLWTDTERCFGERQWNVVPGHSPYRFHAAGSGWGQACSGKDPDHKAELLIQNLQVRNTKLQWQVQGECRQGRCRDKPYCTADSRTRRLQRLHPDPHRFLQQPKPTLEDFSFCGGRSVINSLFLRWVALEQSDNPQLTRTQGFFRCPYRCLSSPIIHTVPKV